MKRYEKYKPSGIEWIGEVPEHWGKICLQYSADVFIDGDWIESPDISTEGIRYITTGNIGALKYKEQGDGYITEETFKRLDCTEVYPGDILISRLNEPIGRCCIIPDLQNRIVTSVDNVIYRPKSDVFDKQFVVYQMNCYPYTINANLLARGTTMHRISRSTLGKINLILPPITEQEAIAAYLHARCGDIDKVVTTQEKRIALLNEMKQSIITQAVTQGLNPDAKMKNSGVEWIGMVPEHWEIVPLKRLAKIKTGSTPPTSKPEYYDGEDVNWFTPGDIGGSFVIMDSERKLSIKAKVDGTCMMFPENTIYFVGIGATIGKVSVCEAEASANQQINAIISNSNAFYKYIAYCLSCQKEQIYLSANTVTLPIINQDKTGALMMPYPSFDEQKEIAGYLDQRCGEIETQIKAVTRQIELLREYKQSLITEVVTGKRKVC